MYCLAFRRRRTVLWLAVGPWSGQLCSPAVPVPRSGQLYSPAVPVLWLANGPRSGQLCSPAVPVLWLAAEPCSCQLCSPAVPVLWLADRPCSGQLCSSAVAESVLLFNSEAWDTWWHRRRIKTKEKAKVIAVLWGRTLPARPASHLYLDLYFFWGGKKPLLLTPPPPCRFRHGISTGLI